MLAFAEATLLSREDAASSGENATGFLVVARCALNKIDRLVR